MYAQCPECLTFFRVTSEQLRAAEGKVRCSKCQNVFNAVATLRETLTEEELAAAREEQGAVQALAASSNLPIDDLFHTAEDFDKDLALEIPGYEGELESDDYSTSTEGDDALDAFLEPDMVDVPPSDDAEFESEIITNDETEASAAELTADTEENLDFSEIFVPRELEDQVNELDGNVAPEIALGLVKKRDWLSDIVWTLLAFGLFATLSMQLVHHYRHTIAAHPQAGPLMLRGYKMLEVEFTPRSDLAALRVTRSTVTAHESLDNTLQLTAVLTNRASFPQHFPILRVLMQDRWGETVGGRYFLPKEYLSDDDPELLMQSNKRYNVDIAVLDPGKEAVGYEMIPCILQKDRRICRENPASGTQ